jgi:peptidoglycan hydrolase CwlO-like protein
LTADQHIEQMIGSIVGQLAITKAQVDAKDSEIAQLKEEIDRLKIPNP